MIEDLKHGMANLVKSLGQKRFYFAYGTGARSDGKGDGALAIGKKKPTAAEMDDECECNELYEGYCWSSTDATVFYFQGKGKKLSPTLVTKMAQLAKKQTGRPYQFAIPPAEEERRAEALPIGGGEAEGPAAPPTAPQAAAPAEEPLAPEDDAPEANVQAAADPTGILNNLNGMVPRVKQAIAAAPAKRDPLLKLVGKVKLDAQGGRLRLAASGLEVLQKAVAGVAAGVAIVSELNGLVPRVKQAIAAAPEKRASFLKVVEKIKTDAQGGRTARAATGLKGLKQVLVARQV
jgi:hypothetical protein